jgi:hypothetical protein
LGEEAAEGLGIREWHATSFGPTLRVQSGLLCKPHLTQIVVHVIGESTIIPLASTKLFAHGFEIVSRQQILPP